jgi:hypothetical protein
MLQSLFRFAIELTQFLLGWLISLSSEMHVTEIRELLLPQFVRSTSARIIRQPVTVPMDHEMVRYNRVDMDDAPHGA